MKNTTRYFTGPAMRRIQSIHFVGIGGVGMGGIAEVLLTQGYKVTGSDLVCSPMTMRLHTLGARIFHQHAAENIKGADVVVVSSAIPDSNVEIISAKQAQIPLVPRATMLAELMRFRYGIAIAGTHGKTTTTSLVSVLLAQGGLDPTFVIGGKLNSAGTNARLGASQYLVAEADESDASFLQLYPMVAVVTNIDDDHLSAYGDDFSKLKEAFLQFLHHLPFYGLALLCIDCPVVYSMLEAIERPLITCGFHEQADYRATDYRQVGMKTQFTIHRPHAGPFSVQLNLPGKHNVQNALAAIAVAEMEGVSDEVICKTLTEFGGIGRRFHLHGEYRAKNGTVLVLEDYGHHPKEIEVTIEAARQAWPDRRLVMAFQPHRYTRTRMLLDGFARVLSCVDVLLILKEYAAGEVPIVGADSSALCRAIRQRKGIDPILVNTMTELSLVLENVLQEGDVLLLQGAGEIGRISTSFFAEHCA